MSNLDFIMTDEQRQAVKDKRITDQEWARNNLNISYADEQYWREKASASGLRLPLWWIGAQETKYVRRACKKLGIDIKDFVSSTGFSNINQFVQNNPRWSALAVVGLCIEYKLGLESRE